ncbi:MAG: hypothetical protein Q9217_001854 [Psora testacea]
MSFQTYENFPSQQGGQDAGGAGAPPEQMGGQMPGNAGVQYEGGDGGQPGSAGGQPQEGDAKTTLWMGELEPWMDENFVRTVWYNMGESVNVKMIRDKFSGNAGYCFIDFSSPAAAAKGLTLNGSIIPNSTRPFKLNWASGGGLADRSNNDRGPEHSIFVGDLGPEVNEYVLVSLFQNRFPSCKSAKIMTDPISGMSRGYGFVRFSEEGDQQRALSEMQGVYCGNRPMRISTATPKNKPGGAPGGMGGGMGGGAGGHGGPMGGGMPYQMGQPPMGFYNQPQPMNQFTDPNNTTVFVGGLSGYVTEDELRSFFQGFGEITYVKIPPGKGCGFVQFVQRHAAEMAINQMQGYPIGNSRVRLSWGRSQNNSGPAGTPYRPAPPPPVYPSMGMPPQHPYGNFAPLKAIRKRLSKSSAPSAKSSKTPLMNDGRGAIFEKGGNWPQIIDSTRFNKRGKTDQLRFPPFHTEMLDQTWVNPAQDLGRIKIIIAEGIRSTPASEFEKVRNVVIFSFHHAPLPILEDTGIAWPNHGMWCQAAPQFDNALSPCKAKEVYPDSHAHSPRREPSQSRCGITPSTEPYHLHNTKSVDATTTRQLAKSSGNMTLQQTVHLSDPFVNDGRPMGTTPSSSLHWQKDLQRCQAYNGGGAMAAHTTLSSRDHDQSMPDCSRPLSPTSLRSVQTPDYTRSPSFTSERGHATPELSHPSSFWSRACSRQMSGWEQALSGFGPLPVSVVQEAAHTSLETTGGQPADGRTPSGQHAPDIEEHVGGLFEDGIAVCSPDRFGISGNLTPVNTRASSAANTPHATSRPSAAKEARVSSYSGKARVVSLATRNLPPSAVRSNLESSAKPRSTSYKSASGILENKDITTLYTQPVITKTPSGNIKGRKEGKAGEIGLEVPCNDETKAFRASSRDYNKGNPHTSEETITPRGDSKRRRISDNIESDVMLNINIDGCREVTKGVSKAEIRGSSPIKHNDIDDLTAEGVVSRDSLDRLEENIL